MTTYGHVVTRTEALKVSGLGSRFTIDISGVTPPDGITPEPLMMVCLPSISDSVFSHVIYELPDSPTISDVENVLTFLADADVRLELIPVFTIPNPSTVFAQEGQTTAYTVYAYDPDFAVMESGVLVTEAGLPVFEDNMLLTFSIVGGADAAKFVLEQQADVSACKIKWASTAPLALVPEDANLDGIYEVNIKVNDGVNDSVVLNLFIHVLDTHAYSFLNASSNLSSVSISQAVNTFTLGLKTGSLWNSLKAVYPFVGGTAAKHKWNLRDPQDVDAAFRLTFNGGNGWTHSATGANPGGSNTYADTFLAPATHLTTTAGAFGIYLRESGHTGNITAMGSSSGGFTNFTGIYPAYDASTAYGGYGDAAGSFGLSGNPSASSAGWYAVGRDSGTSRLFKNGSEIGSQVIAATLPTPTFYLGGYNKNGTLDLATANEICFAFITTESWNSTKNSAFYTLVQALQTALSRNV